MSRAYTALCSLSALLLLVGGADADPVDLTIAVDRPILVQVDTDLSNYAAIGAAYGPAESSTLSFDGDVAIVTVPAATISALVDNLFSGLAASVPGSFSDYVILIDRQTSEVLSATLSGTINIVAFNLDIALGQTASSTATAGFELIDLFGAILPSFCTGGGACTIVPGLPYDPVTGALNAVGSASTSLGNFFTPFGDMLLSEEPASSPGLNLAINGVYDEVVALASGQIQLTVDMFAGAAPEPMVWIWVLVIDGEAYFVTTSGLSTTPDLLFFAPPIDVSAAPLLGFTLPPGTQFTSLMALYDGTGLVASDVITALVP